MSTQSSNPDASAWQAEVHADVPASNCMRPVNTHSRSSGRPAHQQRLHSCPVHANQRCSLVRHLFS